MINFSSLKNKTFYIVGLSVSGKSVLQAMIIQNINCYAWDDDVAIRDSIKNPDINFQDPLNVEWEKIDYLVLSPGIVGYGNKAHISAKLAQANNVKIICDIELLYMSCSTANFIGVTGTNGKSTTSVLLHHLIKQSKDAFLGGNIGIPVANLDNYTNKNQHYILELSSYQLEYCSALKVDTAVLLNLSHDHIERHGNFENYINIKKRYLLNLVNHRILLLG